MDIYARIRQDHDRFRDLLHRLCDGKDQPADRRAALFDALKREVWLHSKVEELVFYSPLMEERRSRGETLEGIAEHHVAERLLDELDGIPKDGEAWMSKLSVLKENLDHHMQEEEKEIFDSARKILSDEQARTMAGDFDRRKKLGLQALTP